jgi:hypothetical protein
MRNSRAGRGIIFDVVREIDFDARWGADSERFLMLCETVDLLEGGRTPDTVFSWSTRAFVDDPINLPRTHLTRPRSRRRPSLYFGPETANRDIKHLDRILSLKSRLARLVAWPQCYPAVKRFLSHEKEGLEHCPLSEGLPYWPPNEFSTMLFDLEKRYPVLREQPFSGST